MNHRLACFLILVGVAQSIPAAPAIPLFDGRSFTGWDGDTNVTWRIRDESLLGGSLEGNPRNEFLTTGRLFTNFILRLEYKLVGTQGFINGGVQIRSRRIANPPNEMSGYQADIGAGYSGFLYDESRRNRMLATADTNLIRGLEKPGDWNRYEIHCDGPRIQLFLNSTRTVDFQESQPDIPLFGVIGLQIHGNCKAQIAFRKITIEELPPPAPARENTDALKRIGPWPAPTATASIPASGPITLYSNETVVFLGQANFVREQKAGHLEAVLATAFASVRPRFRSMAWEGDTVYEQWRDLNFGSWDGQLEWAGATLLILQFGQLEALDGTHRLADFKTAYHRLLDQCARQTQRWILVAPMPFDPPPSPHLPDLSKRNPEVALYADAVRQVARERNARFVDLFASLASAQPSQERRTDNGLHLTDPGLQAVATAVASQLGLPIPAHTLTAPLRDAIAEKNRLWFDAWRPMNWAFAYGDRTHVEFGRPFKERTWLKEDLENFKPLVASADQQIQSLAMALHDGTSVLPQSTPRDAQAAPQTRIPLVASTPPADPSDPQSAESVLATFQSHPAFAPNLFASERDGVVKPIQMTWDERGRLWVACSPTYPHIVPGAKPGDYILVCEDTNADGRADRFHRFAENLFMTQGLELGDHGLYVCEGTELVHFRDTDGDGHADQRRVVLSGFGTGDTHQLINSLSYGPDGAFWFTQGLHIFSHIETPWGISRLDKSGVWRLNPRTLRLDPFFNQATAGHNCWGVTYDAFGQIFHKSGDRAEGYYSLPGLVLNAPPAEYHPRGALFQSQAKTTAFDFVGTAHFPDALQGHVVLGGFMAGDIELHKLIDDSSGFRSEQLPKLLKSNSGTFRPVDVSFGPDGALYIADFHNKLIGHYQAYYRHPDRDKTRGRIWRLTSKSRPLVSQPNLAPGSPAQWLEHLDNPERWTRYQAKRLLFDAPTDLVAQAIDRRLASDPAARESHLLEILGVLESHRVPRTNLLHRLLASSNPSIRAYATRVVGTWSEHLKDPFALLRDRVRDSHPRVRLEAIVASSYIPSPRSIEVAALALDAPRDRFIDYALSQCARAMQPLWQPALESGTIHFESNSIHLAFALAAAKPKPAEHPGAFIYKHLCLNCHQPSGQGLPGIYPPLQGSEWVSGDLTTLIKMLLHGVQGPMTVAGKPYNNVMSPSGLNDRQIADVLTFIRSEFGQQTQPVTLEAVKVTRAAHVQRAEPWPAQSLRPGP